MTSTKMKPLSGTDLGSGRILGDDVVVNVSTQGDMNPDDVWTPPTTMVSTSAGSIPDDLKLDPKDLDWLGTAVEDFLIDVTRGEDLYTATDELWEVAEAIFGSEHATETRKGFVGTEAVREVMAHEFPSLFGDPAAAEHIVWTEPEHI